MKTNKTSYDEAVPNTCDMIAIWLQKYLAAGPEPVDSMIIKEDFERAFPDVSERTLERAKSKVEVQIIRKSGKDRGGTLWALGLNDVEREALLESISIWERELKDQLAIELATKLAIESENSLEPSVNLIRGLIIEKYGQKCSLCDNPNFHFLEIDHRFGGGNFHSRVCRNANKMYQEILDSREPEKYRILCRACNQLARFFSDDEIKSWWKPKRYSKGE